MLHKFTLQTQWDGGRNDIGTLTADRFTTQISIPPEMDGPGIGTNPDEMLLGAAATCYIISLAAMLERTNVKATIALTSEGYVEVKNGVFTYKAIDHYATLTLQELTEKNTSIATRLATKAETTCMISKALKGNVEINVHITVK